MDRYLRYLSRRDVEKVALPMAEIIDVLEEVFLEKARGLTEAPPKPGIHPRPESFIHAMPAFVPGRGAAGIKWVSGYPSNPQKGLPYISGVLILNDPDTGVPIAVMDCAWITAMRTAAASALAARYLAKGESRVLAICGCGVQGRSHLEALSIVLPGLKDVLLYDINPEAAERFLKEASEMYPKLSFCVVASAREALQEADVVVTATFILKDAKPQIQKGWIRPGTFVTSLDFDCYWTEEALEDVDLIVTDDEDQFYYYRKQGYFPRISRPDAELAEILTRQHPGRVRPEDRVLAVFLGLAIEDVATGMAILQRAKEMNLGVELPL